MRPGQPIHRYQALRLAVNLEDRARAAAKRWIEQLPEQAALIGRGRAERTIDSTGADPLRAALSREWFARVFEDEALKRMGRRRPETAVSKTETEHVAECFRTGVVYRIHGPGGAIVLNQNSPDTVPGQTNFNTPVTVENDTYQRDAWTHLELDALATRQDRRRQAEEQIVAADWAQLSPEQRTAFAAYWHREHDTTGPTTHPIVGSLTPTPPKPPTRGPVTYTASSTGQHTPATGPPAEAAAEVFAKKPASVAEANASRALAAAAFPEPKPTSISATGQIRSDPMTRAKDYGDRVKAYTRRYPTSDHGPER